ncbi:unnamed protein product [Trichobilharzia regenti]|nr:unnamed protein product [Trichobilharzia regenti]
MDPQQAEYHMKRCVDSGLWVDNARGGGGGGDDPEENGGADDDNNNKETNQTEEGEKEETSVESVDESS